MVDPESFFHVALKVEDLDASVAFYRDVLDATVLERSAGDPDDPAAVSHAALAVGDKHVYLFDRAPYEASGLVESLPTGFLHFGFVVDDVEAACAELADAGASMLMEPTTFGDLEIAFFRDPDGVRIELLKHLDRG